MISMLFSLLLIGLSAKAQTAPNLTLFPGQSAVIYPYQQTTVSCVSDQTPPPAVTNPCKLSGPGVFNAYQYQYRLDQGKITIQGTDNWNSYVTFISQFRSNGVCQFVPGICQLEGAGAFNKYNYQYRISVDHIVIFGTDNNGQMLQVFKQLNDLGLCSQ